MTRSPWYDANDAYLGAGLHWLRQVLSAQAGDRADVAGAAAAVAEAAAVDPPPAVRALADVFALTEFEVHILLLCLAAELDPATAQRYTELTGDARCPWPTFGLALRVFEDAAWDSLSAWRPLRYWRLVEPDLTAGRPLLTSPLRVDPRILHYAKGLNELDERFDPLLTPVAAAEPELASSQQARAQEALDEWLHPIDRGAVPVLNLTGPDATCTSAVAATICAGLGRVLYRVAAEALVGADVDLLARLWSRESVLLPAALLIDAHDGGPDTVAGAGSAVARFLARCGGPVVVSSPQPWASAPGRRQVRVGVTRPTAAERAVAWSALLPSACTPLALELAAHFELELSAIRDVAAAAVASPTPGQATEDDVRRRVWRACRARTRPGVDGLAHRIDPVAGWDDLVLPTAELDALHRLVAQVRHRQTVYDAWGMAGPGTRGHGITALFAGPSGTGKTLAAEVVAHALDLDLYRVDLSAVVSKFIGETEKNLQRLFDAAEEGGGVLFFDEADALFGKRSEVRDSHDRYANLEVSYLLQRMETYHGLAVLATNVRAALDTAFLRRLRLVVTFPAPSVAERTAIWLRSFPQATPVDGLEFARLAELPLTGGMIRNVALDAAFTAAADGGVITMPTVLVAASRELKKAGRPAQDLRRFEIGTAVR
jgi:hypothetical protein